MNSLINDIYDITILGGGPTGLFAAFYAGLRNSKCKIIDSMPMLGGRLMAIYPDKYIYDVGGLPKILAKDLVQNLVEQMSPYKPTICLEEHANKLEHLSKFDFEYDFNQESGLWKITTDKNTHLTKTLIICAGKGLYTPKKHHAVGSDLFEGRGISYSILNKESYINKNVVIFGGGDSALDWANELLPIAQQVTLVHRSEKFRAHDASIQKLLKSSASILLNYEVAEFIGSSDLNATKLQHVDTREECTINCDSAVIFFGFTNTVGKMEEWGLKLQEGGILINAKMQTNLPGIFAAGDIAKYEGKLDLIATGFSEAATAVAFAKQYINPTIRPQPLYSTTVMKTKDKKNELL